MKKTQTKTKEEKLTQYQKAVVSLLLCTLYSIFTLALIITLIFLSRGLTRVILFTIWAIYVLFKVDKWEKKLK